MAIGSFVGQTTCDEIEKLSTSIVVFMLRGLNENWKQIVSWHLTSKSSNDDIMTQLLFEIVEEAEKIGYKVHGLICDMGPKNQAIWRNLGIKVSRNNNTPFVMHPIRSNDNFYIFPDIPHLLKNLRMALTNNSIITIALSIVESENLPCNEVRFKYLEELNVIQQRKNLKLAPNITTDIVNPTGFNKMNVATAAHIFNVKTAAALETLIELKLIDNEAKTTAWFDAMNSRKQNEAITPSNRNLKIDIIDDFLHLIENIIIGNSWKPVQTGIKMSALNTITLTEYLFKNGYLFFLTSRLNQDAIENLFSTLRRKGNINPTALQAKRCLRLVTLCQFIDTQKEKKNYADDDNEYYIDFFSSLTNKNKENVNNTSISAKDCMYSHIYENNQDYSDIVPITNGLECNVINNVLESAISYVLRKKFACNNCLKAFTVDHNGCNSFYTKALSFGFLENPSNNIFTYITLVEAHLQAHFDRCVLHPQLFEHLLEMIEIWAPYKNLEISKICAERTKPCNFFYYVLYRYIRIRQIIYVNNEKTKIRLSKNKSFGSKNAHRQSII